MLLTPVVLTEAESDASWQISHPANWRTFSRMTRLSNNDCTASLFYPFASGGVRLLFLDLVRKEEGKKLSVDKREKRNQQERDAVVFNDIFSFNCLHGRG